MLSNFDIANITVALVAIAFYFYTAYNAFAIRHIFSVGVYRRQALGMGLVAAMFAINYLNNLIFSYVPPNKPTDAVSTNPGPLGTLIFFLFFFTLFYWIDASVLGARRSDPLLRDTLDWSRIRTIFWILVSVSVFGIITLYYTLTLLFPAVSSAGNQGPPGGVLLAPLFIIPILGVPILGIILLPITARRTRDPLLRKQLYWFGLFALFYFLGNTVGNSIPDLVQALFVTYAIHLTAGYCLYRSAKSLVPLYTFDKETVSIG